jgi:DNA polymerase II small subunit/DNA polymerase delta subunit B
MKVIKVNLNEEKGKIVKDITILPIADVHIGDELSNLKLFKEALERIKKEPNTYTIINGDMCNMALKNSKSDVYGQSLSPMEQVITVVNYLEPIKNKILVISTGNHEDRTMKETNIDVTR